MDLDESLPLLVLESRELLAEMEAALLAIESDGLSDERINSLFRAAHTIKGSAGLFGLHNIVGFTHVMESLLAKVRSAELTPDDDFADLMFGCADHLSCLIDALETKRELSANEFERQQVLSDRLLQSMGATTSVAASAQESVAALTTMNTWDIRLQFGSQILQQGFDPVAILQYLKSMGTLVTVKTVADRIPTLSAMEPETCYLGFELTLESTADRKKIESAFEFVADCSTIEISNRSESAAQTATADIVPLQKTQRGDNLDTTAKVSTAASTTGAATDNRPTGGEKRGPQRDGTTIKLDARKLDQLIDVVGELVIRSASCQAHPDIRRSSGLSELMESVGQLVAQIRDRALDLRMVPIGEVFQRFPRVVRDVSKDLGKRIELNISGADAELDKSMVEKLTDPLMHIVRNAIDHGIESVDERIAAGKPAHGTLTLNAFHRSGAIVIEVSDDGRGLNTDRIYAKAVERGLISAEARLSEQDIFNLIFAPGFSTAEKVTDLSGRGVGMDVVRQNIEQLRGSVEISSTPGEGSSFLIQLPLTLAIIDGFQVAVGATQFVIPLEMVVECIDLPVQNHDHNIFNLRGIPLPYVRLADQFGIAHTKNLRECLVVLACGNQQCGVVVDALVGELQAVIKPLGNILSSLQGFAGSTILGDGHVALVLDIPALISAAMAKTRSDHAGMIAPPRDSRMSLSAAHAPPSYTNAAPS